MERLMNDKKFFTVACSWEVYATMDIEAESLEEAVDIARFDSPLPNEPSYIEDSFKIEPLELKLNLYGFDQTGRPCSFTRRSTGDSNDD